MQCNFSPTELTSLVEQLLAALLPTFEKRVVAASKVTGEQLQCLTVADVAKRLKSCQKTVLKYIGDGRLRAANTSENVKRPQYLVSEADLTAFYKAHRLGR